MLIQINQVEYEIETRTLFKINEKSIHVGDRIGLIGRNGSGKSTLLKIMAQKLKPTQGNTLIYGSVAYLPQIKPKQENMSGGEITQEWIRKIFSAEKDLLLLDEPTTHLDQQNIEKLEKELKQTSHSFVVVSHDREFLDQLCTKIWEVEDGQVNEYPGNYSDYVNQKHQKITNHKKEFEKYVQKRKQLEQALHLKEQKANRATKKPKKTSLSEAKQTGAKPYFAKKQKKLNQGAKAIQSRIDQLQKVEKLKDLPPIKMELAASIPLAHKTLIRVNELKGHKGDLHLWDETSFTIDYGNKLAIVGPNGSGKTTLINELMCNENIVRSPEIIFGYFSQQLEQLNVQESILKNVQETSSQDETLIRTVLARLGFYRDDVYKKVNVLSGGERVKVSLAKIFVSDVNVLILDEPTNFLDLEAVESLEELLNEYPGTVIFVSHDRRFVKNVADKLLIIHEQKLYLHYGSEQDFWESMSKSNPKEELLIVENQIAEVLSRLSLEPSDELEREFDRLLQKKKKLQS